MYLHTFQFATWLLTFRNELPLFCVPSQPKKTPFSCKKLVGGRCQGSWNVSHSLPPWRSYKKTACPQSHCSAFHRRAWFFVFDIPLLCLCSDFSPFWLQKATNFERTNDFFGHRVRGGALLFLFYTLTGRKSDNKCYWMLPVFVGHCGNLALLGEKKL